MKILWKKIRLTTLVLALLIPLVPTVHVISAQTGAIANTISAKSLHYFAIKADGSLWAWGVNSDGVLGDGTTYTIYTPIKIMDNVSEISAGDNHTLAIRTDGSLWAWGNNTWGQLGDGTTYARYAPVKIMDGVSAISAGYNHSLAIKTNGSLWAWGDNGWGEFGDRTRKSRSVPYKVMDDVISVAAGDCYTMAIKTGGSLYVWGQRYLGRDKNEWPAFDVIDPQKIMDDVLFISAGNDYCMAIKTDNTLWAWGNNEHGQLGNSYGIYSEIPVKVMDCISFVSAGFGYCMAIKTDNTLWAWGFNNSGQFGENSSIYDVHYNPIKIMDNVVSVSTGGAHSIMLSTDGALWVYGHDSWESEGSDYYTRLDDIAKMNKSTNYKIMDGIKLPHATNISANPDIPSPWAKEKVEEAIRLGLLPSALDNAYQADITREEFCQIGVAFIEKVAGKDINSFLSGILKKVWVANFLTYKDTLSTVILAMSDLGIVNGYGNGYFKPDNYITREEAAVLLMRIAKILDVNYPNSKPIIFSDRKEFSYWALPGIDFITSCDSGEDRVMKGTATDENKFSPKERFTRQQALVTFVRLYHVTLSYTEPKTMTFRAVLVGGSNEESIRNDCELMRTSLLKSKNVKEENLHPCIAPTIDEFSRLLDEAFADAAWNDVSLIYFSGHGRDLETSIGISLDHALSLSALHTWLTKIPGRIIVILDSCYSGAFITENPLNSQRFSVLCASSEVETTTPKDINVHSKLDVIGIIRTRMNGKLLYGELTYHIGRSIGFYDGNMRADSDRDKRITMSELYNYTSKNNESSTVQMLSLDDSTVLFDFS